MSRPRTSRLLSERLESRRLLASSSTLLAYDFTTTAWQQSPGAQSADVLASLVQGGVGTIDVEGGTTPSGGLRLTVNSAPAGPWTSDLTSGQLAVANTETNLGKLTLSFSLSVSQLKTVKVIVTSYDANGDRTGALATTVNPAATYNYQHYALDLSSMTADGTGAFNPVAPKVSFDYEMSTAVGWSTATAAQLRLDNVNYARPAYYVSAGGSNSNNGKTEGAAFATPQKALDASEPGDVILLMNGTYNQVNGGTGAMHFKKGGTAAAWVSVKNYPGHSPVIYNEAWNAVLVGNGSSTAKATTAAVAYVEVRGLHVIGSSAKVGGRSAPDGPYDPTQPAGTYGVYGQYIGQADPRTNGNGISIDGRYETNRPHDIRFADNIVEDCPGGGIGAGQADRVQIEGNVVRNNAYWNIYGCSGISVLSYYDFDGTSGTYTRLVRGNVSSGNISKSKWAAVGRYSDGNGIIIDYNHTPAADVAAGVTYEETVGRTLVTNNLSFDNGGSGIHAYGAYRVDIVNNVAYLNSASAQLQYGQIYAGSAGTPDSATDVNISNNILVAPVANLAAGELAEPVTGGRQGSAIVYTNNVYYGGNIPANTASYNVNNVIADPKFILASTNPAFADFRLQATSPAINKGTASRAPRLDFAGVQRDAVPDIGAFEFVPSAPTGVTLAAASDTGAAGDNRTRLNNSPAARPSFAVSGTRPDTAVSVYAGTILLGTAVAGAGTTTTVVATTGGTLADGSYAVTATQNFTGGVASQASPTLNLTVDAAAPTLVGTPQLNVGTTSPNNRSQVRTITWTFSEPVNATLASFTLVNRDTGAPVSLATRTATLAGNVLTLTLDRPGVDAGAALFLGNANFAMSLSPTVGDVAGNLLDADGDGTAGETPTFGFYKVLGDFTGDRKVNSTDYVLWNRQYGRTVASGVDAAYDLNGDGNITSADYVLWNRRYNTGVAAMIDGLTYV